MKKFILAAVMMVGALLPAMAKDTYSHDPKVLPEAARTLIDKHFVAKVSVVKIDKDFGRISEYEAVLTDGTEISFDRDGKWDNIETARTAAVPAAFVPKAIAGYVAKNHPGVSIVGIDKERHGYDIELSDGTDIKFNREGKFLRYDD